MSSNECQLKLDALWLATRSLRDQAKVRRHDAQFHQEIEALFNAVAQACTGDPQVENSVKSAIVSLLPGDAEIALDRLRTILISAASSATMVE